MLPKIPSNIPLEKDNSGETTQRTVVQQRSLRPRRRTDLHLYVKFEPNSAKSNKISNISCVYRVVARGVRSGLRKCPFNQVHFFFLRQAPAPRRVFRPQPPCEVVTGPRECRRTVGVAQGFYAEGSVPILWHEGGRCSVN